jgi:hypothetical protein
VVEAAFVAPSPHPAADKVTVIRKMALHGYPPPVVYSSACGLDDRQSDGVPARSLLHRGTIRGGSGRRMI